jgi:hypothetical protein
MDGGYKNMRLLSLYTASHPCQFPLAYVNQWKLSHDYHYQISCEQNSQATGGEYREVFIIQSNACTIHTLKHTHFNI